MDQADLGLACNVLQSLCDEPVDPDKPIAQVDSLTILEWVFVLEEEFERPIAEGIVETITPDTRVVDVARALLS